MDPEGGQSDMNALDTVAKYLFYVLILDFTLEALDQIHRIYEAEESSKSFRCSSTVNYI